jgi:hypothetical protein
MKKYDWFCLIFLFVVLLVGYVLLCILLPISFKNALSYVANLAAIAAAISIYFAIKSANIAKQSFDKTVEKWETEENNEVIAMVNALLEELHINFRITKSLFLKEMDWKAHYWLFCKLFDKNNMEYPNPTDDFNETRNKTMRMYSIFFKCEHPKEEGLVDWEQWLEHYQNKCTYIKYYNKPQSWFFVTLRTNALENILGSGHFFALNIPNRDRLFINIGQLHYSIQQRYNLYIKNIDNIKKNDTTNFNNFAIKEYLLWTHFRLVFLILDILESFNHRRGDLINTSFTEVIYKAMESVNPELKNREKIDRESTTSKTS